MSDTDHLHCPICGNTNILHAFDKHYLDPVYPDKTSIYQCRTCDLYMNWPRLTSAQLYAIYNNGYYFFRRPSQPEFQRIIPMYQRTIALVAEQISDKRVLEIGSAKGYLLAVLAKLNWEVFGVEISTSAADFGHKHFDIPGFAGTLEQFVNSNMADQFPLVLAIDLFEHIVAPKKFMENLNRVVAPGGLLVIDTPNGGSTNILSQGGKWEGFNPFHVFIYSEKNISQLLEQYGFQIEKLFSHSNKKIQPITNPVNGNGPSLIKKLTQNLNLLKPARAARQKIREIKDHKHLPTYLAETVQTIQETTDYFSMPDSQAELAAGHRGDNLVVIARKK